MIGIMRALDRDHKPVVNRPCCKRFSATGAEFGGPEDSYGLASEVEYALLGEPREGAGKGLARDAGGLGHLLPAQGRFEDHAAFGDAALLCSEVEEHTGNPLRSAAEDEVADQVFQFAGSRGQGPRDADGAVGETAHDLEQVAAEDGVEHAVGQGCRDLALGPAFQGRGEAEHRAVAHDAQDLVSRLRTARGTVELYPPLAHEVHGSRGLALPVKGGAGPELQHLSRDRQILEEPLLEPLEKLELLEPVQLGQVLDRPAPRSGQPRPGRRRVLTVHRLGILVAHTISRTLYTPSHERLQFDKSCSAASATSAKMPETSHGQSGRNRALSRSSLWIR